MLIHIAMDMIACLGSLNSSNNEYKFFTLAF